MKTNSTFKNKNLPSILIIFLVFCSLSSFAQTKYTVAVTDYKFTPKDLNVSVGDTVEWQNTQGYHNVNATQATYPSNPESFGNSLGTNWTFTHIFNTPGSYDYRCDAHFALGMVGTVTVSAATQSKLDVTANFSSVYPNPAHENIFIKPEGFHTSEGLIRIYDVTGKLKFSNIYSFDKQIELDVHQFVNGLYIIELSDNNNRQMLKLIKN